MSWKDKAERLCLWVARGPERSQDGVRYGPFESSVLFGRNPGRTPSHELPDSSISRDHMTVAQDAEEHLFVEDLGTTNGTWIDRDCLRGESAAVSAGMCIRLGDTLLVVKSWVEPDETDQEEPADWGASESWIGHGPVIQDWRKGISQIGRAGPLWIRCPGYQDGLKALRAVAALRGLDLHMGAADGRPDSLFGMWHDPTEPAPPAAPNQVILELQDGPVTNEYVTDFSLLTMPSLCDRIEDLPALIDEGLRCRLGESPTMSTDALHSLLCHPWVGSIEELDAVLDSIAQSIRPMEQIDTKHLAAEGIEVINSSRKTKIKKRKTAPDADQLRALLLEHRGSVRACAQALGVDRKQVYRWLETHGIRAESFR